MGQGWLWLLLVAVVAAKPFARQAEELRELEEELGPPIAGMRKRADVSAGVESKRGLRAASRLGESRVLQVAAPLARTGMTNLVHFQPIVPSHYSHVASGNASVANQLVTEAEQANTEAADAQADASEREGKARLIGEQVMELLQTKALKESGHVGREQKVARASKDDFIDAYKANSNTVALLASLSNQTRVADQAYLDSKATTWQALEGYDQAEDKSRDIGWLSYMAKDRMAHKVQRAKDNQAIEEYIGFYASSELKVAINAMNALEATANSKIQLAHDAKKAAEAADEDNQIQIEFKEQQDRLAAAREKQMNHEAKVAREQAERDAELAAQQEEEMAEDLAGNATEQDEESKRRAEQQRLNMIMEAAEMAKFAAKAAAKQAAANKRQAEEAEAAVERLDKVIKHKAELKQKAATALQAENLARDEQVKLARKADALYRISKAGHAKAHQTKLRADGEFYIGKQAAIGTVKVQTWYKQTQADVEKQLRHGARVKELLDEVTVAYQQALQAEEQARAEVLLESTNVNQTSTAMEQSQKAWERSRVARRQAWRSSHRAGSADMAITRIGNGLVLKALELADESGAVRSKASGIEEHMEQQLADRNKQLETADDLYQEALESKDLDARVAAERAQHMNQLALEAAQHTMNGAIAVVDGMRDQANKIMIESGNLNVAATQVGNGLELAAAALGRAQSANNLMREAAICNAKASQLWSQSSERLSAAERTLAVKKQLREEKEIEVKDAEADVDRKARYQARANSTMSYWEGRVGEADEYANAATEAGLALVEDWKTQVKQAENASVTTKGQFEVATRAMDEIEDQNSAVRGLCQEAGLEMMFELASMQKKWALVYLEESKLVVAGWEVSLKATEDPIKKAVDAMADTDSDSKQLILAEDTKMMEADKARAMGKVLHSESILLEEKRRKERVYAHDQLHLSTRMANKLQKTQDNAEHIRRSTTLKALTTRVQEAWRGRARLELSPARTLRSERSKFVRIVAGWNRDGTPIGPGKLDNWMLADVQGLIGPHETKPRYVDALGQTVITSEPGFLNPEILGRCSSACEGYTEMECDQGTVGEACTKGQVFRARYQYSETLDAAQADWFICRCNSGVMQFSSSESLSSERTQGKLMKLDMSPQQMSFDVRLHSHELLPESWVKCWNGFRHWLNHDANFTISRDVMEVDRAKVRKLLLSWEEDDSNPLEAPFSTLDRLALAPLAEPVFLEVRQMWERECVGIKAHEPVDVARSLLEPAPPGRPGGTDSSIDFFDLVPSKATSLDPHNWPTRATRFHELAAQQSEAAPQEL
eukprot:TRINITY_DN357_c0_g1_i2.p1 TRINITY_DN357_c0_g1~~TRINITY_DN357_c0_g1_i2.p1  ORF type:complete len:1300 (-),score=450.50 TRINITY_DN357_c0_g1_i2:85-3984(-)